MPDTMNSLDVIAQNDLLSECTGITEGCGYDVFGILWKWVEYPDNPSAAGFSYVSGSEILEDIMQRREIIKLSDISKLNWSKADAAVAHLDHKNKLTALFWESGPLNGWYYLWELEGALVAMMRETDS